MEQIELIEKAKNKDNDAYQELLKNYSNMIYYIINDFKLDYGDYKISKEDLYQEACIALYQACRGFKDNNKAKFSTFAYMVIKRRLIHCYKVEKSNYNKEPLSIDAFEYYDRNNLFSDKVSDNSFYYQSSEEIKNRIIKPIKRLNEEDRKILLLRMENYSYAEIAEKLNITTKRIDNRLCRLKKRYLKSENEKVKK